MVWSAQMNTRPEQKPLLQVHYLEQPANSYVKSAIAAAIDIHREGLPGDMLIFMTGQSLGVDTVKALSLHSIASLALSS